MKKIFLLTGVVLICFGVVSKSFADTTCAWEKDADGNDTTKLIISGSGNFSGCPDNIHKMATEVVIEYGITSIGESAFLNAKELVSVTLPNSLKTIGGHAFKQATKLQNINVPESVTTIAGYAFEATSSLESINLPDTVKTIGDGVFLLASNLTSINIPKDITKLGHCVFCRTGKLTELNMYDTLTAENVNKWAVSAFQGSSFTNITCIGEDGLAGEESACVKALEKFLPDDEGNCQVSSANCLLNVQKIGNTCVGKYFGSTANDGTCITKANCTNNGNSVVNVTTRKCMPTEDCFGIYTLDKENKRCSQIPGCIDFAYDACVCDNGWLGKEKKCVTEVEGCGTNYKNMGGFCNRVRYTPAEAAAVANDDNTNVVTITFRK